MNRILLILLFFAVCLNSCSKSNDVVAQVKAQGVIDDGIITSYLNAHNLSATKIDTTGVYYIVDSVGTGNALFTLSTTVTVGYKGTVLTTGKVFGQTDSFHPSYVLGQTIRGWQVGIPKVKQNGTITLFLPSRYAYGPYAQPNLGLPENAVLIFDIKLYNITN